MCRFRTYFLAALTFSISLQSFSQNWTYKEDVALLMAFEDACLNGETGIHSHTDKTISLDWFKWKIETKGSVDPELRHRSAEECHRRCKQLLRDRRVKTTLEARAGRTEGEREDGTDFAFLRPTQAPKPQKRERTFSEQCAENDLIIEQTRQAKARRGKAIRAAAHAPIGLVEASLF